jgi:dihydrofolate synthase/folylpolyglutamate synthase
MNKNVLEKYNEIKKKGSVLGLDRIKKALELLGNPQEKLKMIQVTGTNGKGSTSTFLKGILKAHGFRVGYYSSPELEIVNERIRIDESLIDDESFEKYFMDVYKLPVELTEFEVTTIMGLKYFLDQNVDFVIMEVGLGGMNDATNVSRGNIASIFTRISFDHGNFLGNSIEDIAREKSGIIKDNSIVISARQKDNVDKILRNASKEKNNTYTLVSDLEGIEMSSEGSIYYFLGNSIKVPLLGEHQVYNSALAIQASIEIFNNLGIEFSFKKAKEGLMDCRWEGRMEIISDSPLIIIDGAHNLEAAMILSSSIKEIYNEKFIGVFGVLSDKEYEKIIEEMKDVLKLVIAVEPGNPRALKKEDLLEILKKHGLKTYGAMDIEDGIKLCMDKYRNEKIIVFGSLYMLGKVRQIVKNNNIVT